MKNILIKSMNDYLILDVKSINDFEKTIKELEDDFVDLVDIFPDNKFKVILEGKKLSENELEEIYVVVENSGLNISFIGEETFLTKNYIDKPKTKVLENSKLEEKINVEKKETIKEMREFLATQNETIFHTGSLRSGQNIDFEGSVVIIGDVNAGADIKAKGNIICLGAIRGMAHAGSSGNKDCYIYAHSLTPTQLRIADIITFLAPDVLAKNKNKPTYAQIQKDNIIIEHL
ncbi:MAG: septum site-determining protein MinC [Lachnospirales bacterium]